MKRFNRAAVNRRTKQLRVSSKREKRKLGRRGKRYDRYRESDAYVEAVNASIKLHGKFRGTRILELPSSFDMDANREATTQFINALHLEVFKGHHRRIVLDHAPVKSMTLDAALLLVAEIQRCKAYTTSKKTLTGTYPQSEQVGRLLSGMGFYDALLIKCPNYGKVDGRTYSKVVFHNKIIPERADYLLDCFERSILFGPVLRKALYVALLECMDNCYQHAYQEGSDQPHLTKQWWLAGFSDLTRGQIAFSFFDQGATIPSTIRSRPIQLSLGKDILSSDASLIAEASRRRMSRFGGKRRGYGLPFLRKFIQILDQERFQGMLHIVSNEGDFRYLGGSLERKETCRSRLQGTLLTWTIKSVGAPGDDQNIIDLT